MGGKGWLILGVSLSLVFTAQVSKDAKSPGACGQVPQTQQPTQSDARLDLGLPKVEDQL